ncbi:unnamed protein product, partial [Durusdinium trenchii]
MAGKRKVSGGGGPKSKIGKGASSSDLGARSDVARITMASTSTRRPPHVFNLMRQLDVLERAGSVTAAESAWKSAASVSRAFDIGKAEGQALFHLRKNDPKASPWSLPMSIGPLSLVKVSDMLGYDPDSRPGATARAEQML